MLFLNGQYHSYFLLFIYIKEKLQKAPNQIREKRYAVINERSMGATQPFRSIEPMHHITKGWRWPDGPFSVLYAIQPFPARFVYYSKSHTVWPLDT